MKKQTITEQLFCDNCDSELVTWNYKICVEGSVYDFCSECQDKVSATLEFLIRTVGMYIKYEVIPFENIEEHKS